MDLLELHLKLEKLDPRPVPDASVAYKEEIFKKMNADWADVEAIGKQFATDCREVSIGHHPHSLNLLTLTTIHYIQFRLVKRSIGTGFKLTTRYSTIEFDLLIGLILRLIRIN